MPGVFKQKRRLLIADHELGKGKVDKKGVDYSVEINFEEEVKQATIEVYNLSKETRDNIPKGDEVIIGLGWENGNFEQVFLGKIMSKTFEYDGQDKKLTIKAKSVEGVAYKASISRSWSYVNPYEIIDDTLSIINLDWKNPESVKKRADRLPTIKRYTMDRNRPIKSHIEVDLVDMLEQATGYKWEAMLDGYFSLTPYQDFTIPTTILPVLRYDTILLEIGEATQEGKKGGNGSDKPDGTLEADLVLDPRINKGQMVEVDTREFSGVYKVTDYTMESSTTDGTHKLTGVTLRPATQHKIVATLGEYEESGERTGQ